MQLVSMIDQLNMSVSHLNQQLTNLSAACSVCVGCDCPPLQGIDTVAGPLNDVSILKAMDRFCATYFILKRTPFFNAVY